MIIMPLRRLECFDGEYGLIPSVDGCEKFRAVDIEGRTYLSRRTDILTGEPAYRIVSDNEDEGTGLVTDVTDPAVMEELEKRLGVVYDTPLEDLFAV